MARDIANLLMAIAAVLLMAALLAQFTIVPMMANYDQCRRITLCEANPHPTQRGR